MQQVPEITDVGLLDGKRVGAGCYQLLRYSMILLIMFCASSCSRRSDPGGNLQTVSSSSDKSSVEQVLRRGIPGDPLTLDPHVADDDYSFLVIRDLYEGLTAEDRSGLTTPGVASSWTIDRSGTVYTFKVRSNAYWSNGQRVVADEFVQGLRRAVDPQTASGSEVVPLFRTRV